MADRTGPVWVYENVRLAGNGVSPTSTVAKTSLIATITAARRFGGWSPPISPIRPQ